MVDLDSTARWAFGIQLLGVHIVIRSFFAGMGCLGEPKGRKWREAPLVMVGMTLLGIGWGYGIYAYYAAPESLAWMRVGLPEVVRWLGLGTSLVACGYLIWVFKTIGTAGSKHLTTFDDMHLVTSGPYAWIRHPMYTGMLLQGVTWLVMTDHWGVGAGFLLLIGFVVAFRVGHEEEVLLEHFGDDYRQYMLTTGRFCREGSPRSEAGSQRLLHRAPALIDGALRRGRGPGVGVGDRDAAEALATSHPGLVLFRRVVWLPQEPRLVGVPVGPAVDRDGLHVALRVEARRRQGLVELVADVLLEDFEGRGQQLHSRLAPLLRTLNVRRVVHVTHVQIIGSSGVLACS